MGADGTLHLHKIRDHVKGGTAVDGANSKYARLARGDFAGLQLLQGNVDVAHGVDGVHALVGTGAVAAAALDADGEGVARSGQRALERQQRTAGQLRVDVDGKGGVHLGVFQHAFLHHLQSALAGFLTGLEHQLDGALQPVLVFLEDLGRAQQHGRVQVMPAAVRHARHLGRKFQPAFLLHGQCVHVGAQQNGLARLAKFRMMVDYSAVLDYNGCKLFCSDKIIVHFIRLFHNIF